MEQALSNRKIKASDKKESARERRGGKFVEFPIVDAEFDGGYDDVIHDAEKQARRNSEDSNEDS